MKACNLYITLLLTMIGSLYEASAQNKKTIYLDELNMPLYNQGIPAVSVKMIPGGDTMQLNQIKYSRGISVQGTSVIAFLLNGNAESFSAIVGADDKALSNMSCRFYILGDQKILFESGEMKVGDAPKKVTISLTGIQKLGLLVVPKEQLQRTYSNWANAQFLMRNGTIPEAEQNDPDRYIQTPAPAAKPRINSPAVFGATPGNPFLYTIAATGNRPMQFNASGLPQGLSIDKQTGIITGSLKQKGKWQVKLTAKNSLGTTSKMLSIKIGDTIALTPPIGWNGWNSWAREIDREKVIASANAMVQMGLSNHGWNYINIDDAWQGQRGGKFNAIQPNEKFPLFKEMIDQIHGQGLKLGVYSTPWISSYAGFPGGSSNLENGFYPDSVRDNKRAFRYIGNYRFEKNDALQMAAWGVDYLKYDWRIEVNSAERMSVALKESGRDIFYSLSNSAPFANVKDWVKIANGWRTGPDIRDSWLSLFVSAFTLDKWAPFAGPGHWNDPDMMILGNVTTGAKLHPTRLTPDEQYSHVSLFSLLSAPLLIGCPIEQLDAFTLNLLTNDEVIEIDQDPLGKSARLVLEDNGVQVWLKPLEDGSYAIGMFNIVDYQKTPKSYFRWGNEPSKNYILDLEKIGLKGKWTVRDLWRQQAIGTFSGTYKTEIRHHGVVMIRLTKVK